MDVGTTFSRLYISFPRSSNTGALVRRCQLRNSLHLKPRNMREEESDNHQSHSSSPSGSNECLYKVSRPSVQPLLRYFDLTDAGVPKAEPQARLITSFRPHNFFACNVIALLCTISFSSSEFRLYKVWRRSKQQ